MEEEVLVISRDHFEKIGAFAGFKTFDRDWYLQLIDEKAFQFRQRKSVEEDPEYKQLIPYLIFRYHDLLFYYRRSKKGSERRLASLRSIGIGGHINRHDETTGNVYRSGMQRELNEEVEISPIVEESIIGFIYDPTIYVGTLHLGIAHQFILEEPTACSREEAIIDTGWETIDQLWNQREEFETWSQLVLEHLRRDHS